MLQLLQKVVLFKLIFTHYTYEKSYRRGAFLGHWHDYYQLLYVRKGHGEVIINRESYQVREQDVILIWPNEEHGITSSERMDTCELKFRLTDAYSSTLTWKLPRFCRDSIGSIKRTLQQIETESTLVGSCYSELNALALVRILVLMRQYGTDITATAQPDNSVQQDRYLEQIDVYIRENIGRRFTVKEMADFFFTEYTHFSRRFRAKYGVRLQQYINLQRIAHARDMLMMTNLPVTEIAERCGFENLSNLERNFKAEEGISPAQFRRNFQGVQAITLEKAQEEEGGIVVIRNKAGK